MKHMKIGSIYTDMIKPLEKQLYNSIRHHENDERQRLDELYPHLRNIQYNSNKLQHLSNLREIVPVAVETVVKTSAWKDVRVEDVCLASFVSDFYNADESANTLACLFEFDFSDGSKLKMLPTQVGWTPPNVKVTEYLSEWASVVKGEMTVDAFVELLKNKSQGRIPWISDVPELQQLSCDLSIRQKDFREAYQKFIGKHEIGPEEVFEIEPYNRVMKRNELINAMPKEQFQALKNMLKAQSYILRQSSINGLEIDYFLTEEAEPGLQK